MAKQKLSSIFLFLVIIALIGGIVYFKPFQNTAIVGCGSQGVLSIDTAKVTTSSNLAGKQVIRVTTVANKNAECLKIDFNKADLNSKLTDDNGNKYTVDNAVTGDFKNLKQEQVFPITRESQRYFTQINDKITTKGYLCSVNDCKQDYATTIFSARSPSAWAIGDCHCFYPENKGESAIFTSTGTKNFDIDFIIDGIGSTKITNTKGSAKIGEKAFIRWEGDLLSDSWITQPEHDAYYDYYNQDYYLIKKGSYLEAKGIFNDIITAMNGKNYKQMSEISTAYNTNLMSKYLAPQEKKYKSDNLNVVAYRQEGNNFIVSLLKPTSYPVFVIELDAKSVGIHRVEGEPKLSCPSFNANILSGDRADYTFTVSNKAPAGTGNAKFYLDAKCTNGGSVVLDPSTVSLDGQQKQTVNARNSILVSKTGKIQSSCTITASDVSTTKTATCSYEFTGEKLDDRECTTNTCSGNTKIECTNGKITNRVTCEFGCFYQGNEPVCREKINAEICNNGIDDDKDGLIDDKDPDCQVPPDCKPLIDIKNPINSTESWFKIDNPFCDLKQRLGFISTLLGVLTGLGALGIGLAKFKKKKDVSLKVIVTLFSVILGVLVYFLIQNAFDFIFSFWGIVTILIVIVFLLFLGILNK